MGVRFLLSPGLKISFLAMALGYGLSGDRSLGDWVETVAYVALLQGSVVFHEVGHVLVADRLGLSVRSVTLTVFGGYTHYEGVMPSPASGGLIAFAGPLASATLATVLLGLRVAVGGDGIGTGLEAFATVGVALNVLIAAINLLPLPSLDGGQIVASLWRSLLHR